MKKNVNLTLLVFAGLSMAACTSTELSTAGVSYNPQEQARIRLYGQNGRPTTLVVRSKGKTEKVTVGGGIGQAFSSLLYLKGDESIGIPQTKFSQDPSVFNNLGSGAFYKEFIIPANTPISIRNNINAVPHRFNDIYSGTTVITSVSCNANSIEFRAEAGKDYEALPPLSTSKCGVILTEIK